VCTAVVNEKKMIEFSLSSLLKWWRHGTCDHFVAFSFQEDVFVFHLLKMPLDNLGFLSKPEIGLELKSEQ